MIGAGIGALQREYGRKTPRRVKLLVALGLLLIAPIGFLVVGLIAVEPPEDTADWAAAITMAAMFIAIGILPVFVWLARRGTRVDLHEHGIVVSRGEEPRPVRWTEIETIRLEVMSLRVNGIPTGTNCKCTLQTATGAPVVLTHFLDGVLELAGRIEHETTRIRLPLARRVIASGGSVEFGPALALSSRGISKRGGEPLPWRDVASVAAIEGRVVVRKRGKRLPWATRGYGSLPNARVFVELAQELASAHAPGGV